MSMSISQVGVYRMLNGHTDGYVSARAATSARQEELNENPRLNGLAVGASQTMARNIERDMALENSRLAEPAVNESARIGDGDITQLNGGSINMAKFFLNLDSGTAPGPVPMRALMAEENYLKAMGMF